MRTWRAALVAGSLLMAAPALAQVVLDGTIGPSSGLVPSGVDDLGQAATYLVTDDLGEQAGSNLCHSFSQFDINLGQTATLMSSSPAIDNVLARVTGGDASEIYGTLRSTIPGADLFLMNPAGVLFGEGSSLDVPAGLHVTTGHYLRHSDGTRFEASAVPPPILSTAPVEAFGFLDSDAAPIAIEDTRLELTPGATFSLVGGDLTIDGFLPGTDPDVFGPSGSFATSTVRAPSGRANLAAVNSSGEVAFDRSLDAPRLDVTGFERLGAIRLSGGGAIKLTGDPGGVVVVRAEQLVSREGFTVVARTDGDADHPGTGLDIDVGGSVSLEDSGLWSTRTSGAGQGGNIRLRAKGIRNAKTTADFTPRGFDAGSLGPADAGDIVIDAEVLEMDGFNAGIAAGTFSTGRGGNIHIRVDELRLTGTSIITVQSGGEGDAGDLIVEARRVELSRGNLAAFTTRSGRGGRIQISAGQVELNRAGNILVLSLGSGAAGDLSIDADEVLLNNGGNISAGGTIGGAGDIEIRARRVLLSGSGPNEASFITPFLPERSGLASFSTGESGSIRIESEELTLLEGAQINTSTLSFRGFPGGRISIDANRVVLAGSGPFGPSSISSSSDRLGRELFPNLPPGFPDVPPATGRAGDIRITGAAAGSHISLDGGRISVRTRSIGDGGDLLIDFDHVSLADGASITAESTNEFLLPGRAPGRAGSISIVARDTLHSEVSAISAESSDSDGGDIQISAGSGVELLRSSITAEVGGGPETTGGNISIAQPDWVILDNGSRIVANAFEGQGGNIGIKTKALLVSSDSTISASSALGVSGVVAVNAPDTDIIAGLSTLPQEFLDAAQLQRGRCGVPGSGDAGNFAVYESPGVPPPPDGPLPSVLMDFGDGTPAMSELPAEPVSGNDRKCG